MKLPWDTKYIKISFHVVVTVVIIYAFKLCIDLVAYILTNLGEIFTHITNFFGWIMSVCITLIIAFVISYIFDPLVGLLQKKYDYFYRNYIAPKIRDDKNIQDFLSKFRSRKKTKPPKKPERFKKRTAGTALTFMIVFLVIFISGTILVNKISRSGGGNVAEGTIAFINNSVSDFSEMYEKFQNHLKDYGIHEYVEQYIDSFAFEFTNFVKNIGNGLVGFVYSLGSGFLNVVIAIVISFYFLRDKESIKYKFAEVSRAFLPKKINHTLTNVLGDINAVFSGYVRGQIVDASIMAVLIGSGLSILGVDFAIIIGIVSGFSNIIPYFGALIAFILAVSVTLLSGTPVKALYAAILIFILQQIDGIVIGPRVVGNNVKLSPVLVIIALAVAGELFGLWGMVLAVPVFATIKLFAERFFYRQKIRKNKKNNE